MSRIYKGHADAVLLYKVFGYDNLVDRGKFAGSVIVSGKTLKHKNIWETYRNHTENETIDEYFNRIAPNVMKERV